MFTALPNLFYTALNEQVLGRLHGLRSGFLTSRTVACVRTHRQPHQNEKRPAFAGRRTFEARSSSGLHTPRAVSAYSSIWSKFM